MALLPKGFIFKGNTAASGSVTGLGVADDVVDDFMSLEMVWLYGEFVPGPYVAGKNLFRANAGLFVVAAPLDTSVLIATTS